ncbi:MAG: glycosyltransferase [Ignavibacteriaceae bacterium]|nr:glycosyltransferase [Ignavibacteriaceae bacterium]
MKVLIAGDPASSHTVKWANALSSRGIEVFIFGLGDYDKNSYNSSIKIKTFSALTDKIKLKNNGNLFKLIYLTSVPRIKKTINEFKPDILHSFYATSYGLISSLTGFRPHLISVWGSDVMAFPQKSFIHKKILGLVLNKADRVFATSNYLSSLVYSMYGIQCGVIPFGIDINLFSPSEKEVDRPYNSITVGIVKSLEKIYRIDLLLKSFKLLKGKHPDYLLKLVIIGTGTLEKELKKETADLGIENDTEFKGYISNQLVSREIQKFDIAVFPSERESFGVSLLETMACGIPSVVSKIKSYEEILAQSGAAILVNERTPEAFTKEMSFLIQNKKIREEMGSNARNHIVVNYNFENNLDCLVTKYNEILTIK